MKDELQNLSSIIDHLSHLVRQALSESRNKIAIGRQKLISAIKSYTDKKMNRLLSYEKDLRFHVRQILARGNSRLEKVEQAVRLLDPANVLKRGYSITYLQG